VNDDVTAFWIRADLDDPAFTGDELRRLPAAIRRLLESHALIRQSENLGVIECDACGEGHLEEVEILAEPTGSKPRAYITCPEAGRVSVDMERRQQWAVDLDMVARTVAAALDLRGRIVSIAPGRAWLLGTGQFDQHMRDVFLVRGIDWPDSRQILESAPRLATSPCPLILVPNLLPEDPIWTDGGRILMSMSEFNWFGDDSHAVLSRITAILAGHEALSEAETAQPARRRTKTSGATENTTGSQQAPSRHRERVAKVERNFGCEGKPTFAEFYKRLGVTNAEFCAWKREDQHHCGRAKRLSLNKAADRLQ
jgi:hypothetical protein